MPALPLKMPTSALITVASISDTTSMATAW